MRVCAWDTSGDVVSVGLGEINPANPLVPGTVVAQEQQPACRRHAQALIPALAHLLEQADWGVTDVEAVIVGTGPGPFTGLRVGLASAQVFGLARHVPVWGVCSLDALAWQAAAEGVARVGAPLLVVTDALRREVHALRYTVEAGVGTALPRLRRDPVDATPQVLPPAAVELPPGAVIIGSAAARYPQEFPRATGPTDPAASALIGWVGQGLPTTAPSPLYLRRPDTTPPAIALSRV